MGSDTGHQVHYFDGAIDEIKVWTSARNRTQVRFDMIAESLLDVSLAEVIGRAPGGWNGLLINFARAGAISNFTAGAPVCRPGEGPRVFLDCVTNRAKRQWGGGAPGVIGNGNAETFPLPGTSHYSL